MSETLSLESLLNGLSDHDEGIEKSAAETNTPSVAEDLRDALTKKASDTTQINTGETNMSVENGNQIAQAVLEMLEKSASAGNNVIKETDEMEAQHAARIESTPRQGKTVTEVAKALQGKAPAGSAEDAVDGSPEGNSEAAVAAVPSDIEKAAAVNELMESGIDFENAVEMVKQASYELEAEAFEIEKVAAVNELMENGIDFEDAVELVKQASAELLEEDAEYTDLEKIAAVADLMDEDGLSFEYASELVKEAAAKETALKYAGKAKDFVLGGASKAKTAIKEGVTKADLKGKGGKVMQHIKDNPKAYAAGAAGAGIAGAAGGYAASRRNK